MTGDQDGLEAATSFTAEQLRHVLETAVNPFVLIDPTGTAVWASTSVDELLGVPAGELVGRSMLDLVAPESRDEAVDALAHAVDDARRPGSVPAAWEGVGPVLQMLRPDGSTVSCSIAVATPVRTGLPCFVLQLRRSDAAHALEKALLAMGTNRPLAEVLVEVAAVLRGELPDAEVVIAHHDGTGDAPRAVTVPGARDHVDVAATAPDLWAKAVDNPGEVVEWPTDDLPEPLRQAAQEAAFRWVTLLGVAPVVDDDPTTAAVLVIWSRSEYRMHFLNHDRLERCGSLTSMALRWEYGRRALQWAATHDGLTGLRNRASFLTELRAARGLGRRTSDKTAVLYLDLDDFKPVNDLHGHTLGDRVLVEVAGRLRLTVRPTDLIARLGGDEFAILCPGLDSIAAAELLAQRLVTEVSAPMRVEGIDVHIGLSVGISTLGADEDPERVLNRADTALRAAKLDGKARWRVA
jgi:diguanylate cyclase (GGDEF)-like protein/PAS domain S-box-containing protein